MGTTRLKHCLLVNDLMGPSHFLLIENITQIYGTSSHTHGQIVGAKESHEAEKSLRKLTRKKRFRLSVAPIIRTWKKMVKVREVRSGEGLEREAALHGQPGHHTVNKQLADRLNGHTNISVSSLA